jgi:hypothetical protein
MRKYKIGALELRMEHRWARAARDSDKTELTIVYDKYFEVNERIGHMNHKCQPNRSVKDTGGAIFKLCEEFVYNVAKKLDLTRISVLVSRCRFNGENTILR